MFPCDAPYDLSAPSGACWREAEKMLPCFGCDYPYHVVVQSRSNRRVLSKVDVHYIKNMPPGTALYFLSPSLLAPSAEFCLLQMASEWSFLQTLGAAYEMCGYYTPAESAKRNPRKLSPVTTKESMRRYLDSISGMHGMKQMRKVANYVLDNSRSIKETQLAILLTLPRNEGGMGLPEPKLNCGIFIPPDLRRYVSQNEYTVDMLWPQWKLAVEYDSSLHHANSFIQDAARRNDLQFLGYTVVQATSSDLRSSYSVARFATKLAASMDSKIEKRFKQLEVSADNLRLFDEVMDLSRYP